MKKNLAGSILASAVLAVTLSGCGEHGRDNRHVETYEGPTASASQSNSDSSTPRNSEAHGHDEESGHGHEHGHSSYRTGANNARQAAEILVTQGPYSRAFTIELLTDPESEGYSMAEAEKAVDSLHINWREQARRAAIDYMDIKKFTCQEMKEQLSATYANHFTQEEANWGAEHSPACQRK